MEWIIIMDGVGENKMEGCIRGGFVQRAKRMGNNNFKILEYISQTDISEFHKLISQIICFFY